jgi:hypothetical protein
VLETSNGLDLRASRLARVLETSNGLDLRASRLARVLGTCNGMHTTHRPLWKDLDRLHWAVHSEQRTTNPTEWRRELDAVLDVESFLKVRTLIYIV